MRPRFLLTENVRFGSKADMTPVIRNVRFTPESGHLDSVLKAFDFDF
jgi:hypothetical protein